MARSLALAGKSDPQVEVALIVRSRVTVGIVYWQEMADPSRQLTRELHALLWWVWLADVWGHRALSADPVADRPPTASARSALLMRAGQANPR